MMTKHRAWGQRHLLCSVLLAIGLSTSDNCTALTINLTYTHNTAGEPANDPNGIMLQSIMRAAADAWEDIILDSHTMTINYYYVGSLSNNALADALDLDAVNSRVTEGQIRVNGPNYDWYFDLDPDTDVFKYDFTQTLYRDLTSQQQSDWFNGDVPDLLEVGYRGTAQQPYVPAGMYDLYSTMVHEIGHLVGVPGSKNYDTGSMTDGEYDIDPTLVGGHVMAALMDDLTPDEANDLHLAAQLALMCRGCGAVDLRRRITATDVLAAASTANWTQIDLLRKEFIGGYYDSYNVAENWIGNRLPDSQDVVNMRSGSTHQLGATGYAGDLFLLDGTDLITYENSLDASHSINIVQSGAAATILRVSNYGRAEADDLNIDGGRLVLEGGTAIGFDGVTLNSNGANVGQVSGYGVLGAPDWLLNDGIIKANGGTLTISEDPYDLITPSWVLDGNYGNGQLEAIYGDLVIDGPVNTPFDGDITVGAGHSITFTQDWTLDQTGDGDVGTITLEGNALSPAVLNGPGEVNIAGQGVLTADKIAHVNAPVKLNDNGLLRAPHSDDLLVLNNTTTFNGGIVTGLGTVVQNGDVVVHNDSEIFTTTYDWDGETNDSTTTIINGTFTVDVLNLGDGADTFAGIITAAGGTLEVKTLAQWTMAGTMNLSTGFGTIPGEVTGTSDMILTGELNVNDTGIITADTVFTSYAQINVPDADDTLILEGDIEFQGGAVFDGAIYGDGVVKANDRIDVTGNFQLNTGVYDWDGDTENTTAVTKIYPGATLYINAPTIEPDGADDVYDGYTIINGGTLEVNTGTMVSFGGGEPFFLPSTWTLSANGKLELIESGGTPATINGSPIYISGDLDVTGEAVINTTITTQSTTDIHVSQGGALTLHNPSTAMVYRGGTFTGQGTIVHDGYIVVHEPTSIDVAFIDLDGPSNNNHVTLNSSLTLGVNTWFPGGTFAFAGNMDIYPDGSFNWDRSDTGMIVTGQIGLNNSGMAEHTMMAVPLIALLNGGTLDINGMVAIDGAVTLLSTGNLLLEDSQDVLHLLGNDAGIAMQIVGATLSGDGTLKVSGSNLVVGNGEIAVDIDFDNTTSLEAAASTLSITGNIISAGSIGTYDDTGILNTPGTFVTANVQQVNLKGGQWQGGTIIHSSLLTGFGKVATAAFANEGSIEPAGGTLLFSLYDENTGTTQVPDLDGVNGSGQILLHDGSMEIRNASGLLPFAGQLEIGSSQSFVMPTGGLNVGGTMKLYAGNYDAPQLDINGTVSIPGNHPDSYINSDVTISYTGELTGSSAVHISGSIEFDHDNAVSSSTYTKGGVTSIGQVIIDPMAILRGSENQTVNLANYGTVQIGESWNSLVVRSYQQQPGAVLEMQIGGDFLKSNYDQLYATDIIDLNGGMLDLVINGTRRYRIGDTFVILQASNALMGEFSMAMLDTTSSMGLGLIYDTNSITARFQRLGDLNYDGFVGIQDLNAVLGNWNQDVIAGVWSTGDSTGDGFVGIEDLNAVLGNWNTGTPPQAQANIPEPATVTLMILSWLTLVPRKNPSKINKPSRI